MRKFIYFLTNFFYWKIYTDISSCLLPFPPTASYFNLNVFPFFCSIFPFLLVFSRGNWEKFVQYVSQFNWLLSTRCFHFDAFWRWKISWQFISKRLHHGVRMNCHRKNSSLMLIFNERSSSTLPMPAKTFRNQLRKSPKQNSEFLWVFCYLEILLALVRICCSFLVTSRFVG